MIGRRADWRIRSTEAAIAILDEVKTVWMDILQLGPRSASIEASTSLLGNVPELDSMAVVNRITVIEEHFGIVVADDEISAETFDGARGQLSGMGRPV